MWPVVETPAVETTVTAVTAVAEKISAVAAEAAPAIKKEVTKMEATIKDATVKGEALIADMNTRAKAAMEKGTKAFEQINEFNKGNVEALVESSKIAAKGFETLGQGYAEYARKQFEGTTAAIKSFAGVKSPTEFFKLHVGLRPRSVRFDGRRDLEEHRSVHQAGRRRRQADLEPRCGCRREAEGRRVSEPSAARPNEMGGRRATGGRPFVSGARDSG